MSEPTRRSSVVAPALVLLSAMVVLGLNMGVRQTAGLFLEPMTQDLGISRTSFAFAQCPGPLTR